MNEQQQITSEIQNRKNILVVGKSGAGKSSFINYLAKKKIVK